MLQIAASGVGWPPAVVSPHSAGSPKREMLQTWSFLGCVYSGRVALGGCKRRRERNTLTWRNDT